MSEPNDPTLSTQPVRPEPDGPDQSTQPVRSEPVRSEPVRIPTPAATPAEPEKGFAQRTRDTVSNVYHLLRILVMALLGAILGIFVIRNWDDVPFDYVLGDASMPLAVIMLVFAGIGILIGMLLSWLLRRRT